MPTRRRGAGEGGVYQEALYRRLASGERVEYRLWVGVVETDRDPSTGQRWRVKVRAKTNAEAVAKMRTEQDRIGASGAPQEGPKDARGAGRDRPRYAGLGHRCLHRWQHHHALQSCSAALQPH